MQIYDYNSDKLQFRDVFDELGGKTGFEFRFYDCFCGCPGYEVVSTTTRHHNNVTIVSCSRCGTLRTNPYFTDKSIEIYYKEVYGPVKRKGMSPEKLYEIQAGKSQELYEILSGYIDRQSSILDFGAGAGGRLDFFLGKIDQVHIFDYDDHYMDFGRCKGHQAKQEGQTFDVVVLSHVLEHINEPVPFLKQLADEVVNDGGLIYIEVPLIDGNSKLLLDFHIAHKWYFTSQSLLATAVKAGYVLEKTVKNGVLVRKSSAPENKPDIDAKAYKRSRDIARKAINLSNRRLRRVRLKNAILFR